MPSKTITQISVTRAEIYRVVFRQVNDLWTVDTDYEIKDSNGNSIARHTISVTPGLAAQTSIKGIVDICVSKANQEEET